MIHWTWKEMKSFYHRQYITNYTYIYMRRNWQPTPVLLLGELHEQRRLAVHGIARVRDDLATKPPPFLVAVILILMIIAMVKIHSWKISGEKKLSSVLLLFFKLWSHSLLSSVLQHLLFLLFCLFIYFWTMKRVGSSSPGGPEPRTPAWQSHQGSPFSSVLEQCS